MTTQFPMIHYRNFGIRLTFSTPSFAISKLPPRLNDSSPFILDTLFFHSISPEFSPGPQAPGCCFCLQTSHLSGAPVSNSIYMPFPKLNFILQPTMASQHPLLGSKPLRLALRTASIPCLASSCQTCLLIAAHTFSQVHALAYVASQLRVTFLLLSLKGKSFFKVQLKNQESFAPSLNATELITYSTLISIIFYF